MENTESSDEIDITEQSTDLSLLESKRIYDKTQEYINEKDVSEKCEQQNVPDSCNEIFLKLFNSENDFVKQRKSNETMVVLPEFEFIQHDFSELEFDKSKTMDVNLGQVTLSRDSNVEKESVDELNTSILANESERKPNDTTVRLQPNLAKSIDKKFTILHEDELSEGEKDSATDDSMVALLRSAISELERALRDSRALIKTRDEDIANVRKEVEKGRSRSPLIAFYGLVLQLAGIYAQNDTKRIEMCVFFNEKRFSTDNTVTDHFFFIIILLIYIRRRDCTYIVQECSVFASTTNSGLFA